MKDRILKPGTNFWFILGTIIFFVLSFLIYLLYYIPNNESKIIATRFRVLDQMGDNINAKVESYQGNALTIESWIQREATKIATDLQKQYPDKFPYEKIVNYLLEQLTNKKNLKLFNENLRLIFHQTDTRDSSVSFTPTFADDIKLNKNELDEYFLFDPITITTGKNDNIHNVVLQFGATYEKILYGLERDDVFDQVIVIRNKVVVFSTLKADIILDTSNVKPGTFVLSLSEPQKPKLGEVEKISDSSGAHLISGEYSDLTISNEKYKLFFKPVKVKGDYWYIGGLVKSENFYAEGRSIDQWIIMLLSLVLIMLILGLPLIKLKVISKTDELKTASIINSTLAILLGTSFLTLFIMYLSQSIGNIINTDKKLKDLSYEIDSSFTEEITVVYKQLKEFDSLYTDIKNDEQYLKLNNTEEGGNYVENILDTTRIEFTKKWKDKTKTEIRQKYSVPNHYPYEDYVFWLNDKGKESYYLTPYIETTGEMSDLGYRDYFNKSDEWFFPVDPTKKFRMESIVSITSGIHSVALSTPSITGLYPVVALTSQFYSLIDPILPRNYGFCIIDEDGKVWFHSNKNRNLMENFISECNDNKSIKAALYNRVTVPINVKYYNKPLRIYIKPLKNLPLYLVTFYSNNDYSSFQAEVFTVTLIFIALFFLLIVLQITIILILDRLILWKLMRNIILSITRPRVHLQRQNIFLMRLYIVVVIVSSVIVSLLGNFQSFAFLFVSEIIIFVFSFWVLNDNDLKKKQLKSFAVINFGILILLNVVIMSVKWSEGLEILAYEIGLIVFLLISYQIFLQKKSDKKNEFKKDFIHKYVLLLICFTIFFSIFPTIIFYKITYNLESNIHTRHYQVDAMKKREIRNAKWNNYYSSRTNISSSMPILQKRKDKGIYTRFLYEMEYLQKPDSALINNREPLITDWFDEFVTLLRPFYNDAIIEDKFLLYGDQKNDINYWINTKDDFMILRYLSNTEDPSFSKQDTMLITAKADRLNFLTPIHGESFTGLKSFSFNLIIWIILLSTLCILYYLIRFGLRSIYSLDILLSYYPESFGKRIAQRLLTNKIIFIVKQSHLDSTKELYKSIRFDVKLNWSENNIVKQLDILIDEFIKNTISGHNKAGVTSNEIKEPGLNKIMNPDMIVFIDNFEMEYNMPSALNVKLKKLEMLTKQNNSKLIIVSNLHPAKIIEIHNLGEKREIGSNDLIHFKDNMNLLEKVLNNVVLNYLPIKGSLQEEDIGNGQLYEGSKLEIVDLINAELNASDYLLQFKNTLLDYYEGSINRRKLDNPEELIIEKINTLAGNYYEELFHSCTAEELFVIFDLADDLIINQKNKEVIYGLLDKGILIKKIERISFFNVSFRRFVLSKRNKSTIKDLEEKIGKESSPWQGYRIVLMLVVVSIFIFIALANQDLMKNISQLFVMIGGALATITSLFGMIAGRRKSTDN